MFTVSSAKCKQLCPQKCLVYSVRINITEYLSIIYFNIQHRIVDHRFFVQYLNMTIRIVHSLHSTFNICKRKRGIIRDLMILYNLKLEIDISSVCISINSI